MAMIGTTDGIRRVRFLLLCCPLLFVEAFWSKYRSIPSTRLELRSSGSWCVFARRPKAVLEAQNNNRHCHHSKDEERTVVIAYHKPANVITSHSDPDALASGDGKRTTVYEEITDLTALASLQEDESFDRHNLSWEEVTGIRSKLHAIGRLDCQTTGLLLLTNDGGLVHHVTNPNAKTTVIQHEKGHQNITKTYEAIIMGHHENNCPAFQMMRQKGIDIGAKYGGMTKPVNHLQVLEYPSNKTTRVTITISEGKNRQIRRMFHSMGSGVIHLKRTQIGDHLDLEGLQEGQWKILSDSQVWHALNWRTRRILHEPKKTTGRRTSAASDLRKTTKQNVRAASNKRRRRTTTTSAATSSKNRNSRASMQ